MKKKKKQIVTTIFISNRFAFREKKGFEGGSSFETSVTTQY